MLALVPQPAHAPGPHELRVHRHGDAARPVVEAFIARAFAERFGAQVRRFAPLLVSLHDGQGRLVAAAGYRPAGDGPLFLERYLPAPAERQLGVPRSTLVEVGHLASVHPGAGRQLIARLAPHLAGEGYGWVVSTLTEQLRLIFVRLGIVPQALGLADPALLGEEAADWGSYYAHHPVVGAGAIGPALGVLSRRGGTA